MLTQQPSAGRRWQDTVSPPDSLPEDPHVSKARHGSKKMLLRFGAATSHSQGDELSWEKSYIAYLGKENRSNIHE